MKIIKTNSEQWEIRESGMVAVVAGGVAIISGVILAGWWLAHLQTMAWWWSAVGVGVATLGVLIIFSASSKQVILRRQGTSEVVTTKVVGHKQVRLRFERSQIVSVNLDTSDQMTTSSSSEGTTTTRERSSVLYVMLSDNNEVVLATRRSNSGANGVSVSGVSLSGFGKAPLSDEAQQIAQFYGVPLSSRANNMSSAEAVASVVGAVRQGIASAQPIGGMPFQSPQQSTEPVVSSPVPLVPAYPSDQPQPGQVQAVSVTTPVATPPPNSANLSGELNTTQPPRGV